MQDYIILPLVFLGAIICVGLGLYAWCVKKYYELKYREMLFDAKHDMEMEAFEMKSPSRGMFISVNLGVALNTRLASLCKSSEETKEYYIRCALKEFLDEVDGRK